MKLTEQRHPGKLLVDACPTPVRLQLVEDARGGGRMRVRGEFARADIATENKRVYSGKLWEREIGRLNKSLEHRQLFGECDHPDSGTTKISRVSHVITGLALKDGVLVGEAEILDTANGRNLKAIFESGCSIGVSSRGYGSTKPSGEGTEAVQDDYKLVTFDFVADPADSTAYPEVYFEGVDPSAVKDRVKESGMDAQEMEQKLESARREEREKARRELKEEFSRELVEQVKAARQKISDQVKAELLSDPEVAAAKTVMEEIKGVLRPFILPEDVETAYKAKDVEITKYRNQISERDLRIKELEGEIDQLSAVAKEAGYKFYLETQIGADPDAEFVRQLIGDVKAYRDAEELKAKLESVRGDLAKRRLDEAEEKKKKDAAEAVLADKVSKLQATLTESLELNRKLALRIYTEGKLAKNPNAGKLRVMLESAHPESKEEVDELMESFTEHPKDQDEMESLRSRIRSHMGGGGDEHLNEDSLTAKSKTRAKQLEETDYNNLGAPLQDLQSLAGINSRS